MNLKSLLISGLMVAFLSGGMINAESSDLSSQNLILKDNANYVTQVATYPFK